MSRFRPRLALKIVLPFAALTLAIGAVGTLTATSALSSRSQEAFDNQLIHDGFVAQSMVQAGDADRRSAPRLLANRAGRRPNLAQTPAPQAWPERAPTVQPHVVLANRRNSWTGIAGGGRHGRRAR